MNGKLIQVNRELLKDVLLIKKQVIFVGKIKKQIKHFFNCKQTYSNGWIAMILPPFQSKETDNLMDYNQYIAKDNK